jgi:hypothetical protein
MTTAEKEIREIRKQLAESGADPFHIAATALAEVRRYRQLLEQQSDVRRLQR